MTKQHPEQYLLDNTNVIATPFPLYHIAKHVNSGVHPAQPLHVALAVSWLSIVWVLSEKCHVSNVSQLFSQWWLRLTTEESQVERTQLSGDTGVLSLPGHYTAAWGTFMQASCTLQGVEVTRPSNPSKYVSPPAELSANPQIKVAVCPATTCGPYTIPLQRTALYSVSCALHTLTVKGSLYNIHSTLESEWMTRLFIEQPRLRGWTCTA